MGDSEKQVRLEFKQKLTGKLPTQELVKRLKELHNELKNLDQETVEQSSMDAVAKELVSTQVLRNTDDKAVRIFAACCLADILRLYAPEAPYDGSIIKDIFELFVKQLRGISDTEGPYFTRYFYLLESLATVKTCILLVEQNADDVVFELFKTFFEVINPKHSKLVYGYMLDIMQQIIEESDQIPQETLDLILAHLLPKSQKETNHAYRLTADLLHVSAGKLKTYMSNFFTAVLSNGGSASEFNSVEVAHELVYEIYKVAPAVLLSVIPILEQELKVDDIPSRLLATKTAGKMLSERGSNLAQDSPNLWKLWVDRSQDAAASVRLERVALSIGFYEHHPNLCSEINRTLLERFQDPDDRVRLTCCSLVTHFTKAAPLEAVSVAVFKSIQDRTRDKKPVVREAAIDSLAHIHRIVTESTDLSKGAAEQYNWVQEAIFKLYLFDDCETRAHLEKIFERNFVTKAPVKDRVVKLLALYRDAGDHGRNGFARYLHHQAKFRISFRSFIALILKQNKSKSEETNMKTKLLELAQMMPSPQASLESLKKIADFDPAVLKNIHKGTDDSRSDKDLLAASTDFLARFKPKPEDFHEILARRIFNRVVSKATVNALFELVNDLKTKDGEEDASSCLAALSMLKDIAAVYPKFFEESFSHLSLVDDLNLPVARGALNLFSLAIRYFPKEIEANKFIRGTLEKIAMEEEPTVVENAAAILLHLKSPENSIKKLLQFVMENLVPVSSAESGSLLASLALLHQLVSLDSAAVVSKEEEITRFLVSLIKTNSRIASPRKAKKMGDWVTNEDLDDEGKAKLLALRILVRYVQVHFGKESEKDKVKFIMQLMWKLVVERGEVSPLKDTCASHKLRLMAASGCHIIDLCILLNKDSLVPEDLLLELGLLLQDPSFDVRKEIGDKLRSALQAFKLPVRFFSLLFLTAHEPEKSLMDAIKIQVQQMVETRRTYAKLHKENAKAVLPEYCFAHLLFVLAIHPDFNRQEMKELASTTRYLEHYLEFVATQDNSPFLFHIAQAVKRGEIAKKDKQFDLYAVCDLAQLAIQEKCKAHQWALDSYPGTVDLPKSLYTPLPATVNTSKSYIPQAYYDSRATKTHKLTLSPPPKPPKAGAKGTTPGEKKKLLDTSMQDSPSRKNPSRVAKVLSENIRDDSDDESDEDMGVVRHRPKVEAQPTAESDEDADEDVEMAVPEPKKGEKKPTGAQSRSRRGAPVEEQEDEEEEEEEPLKKEPARNKRRSGEREEDEAEVKPKPAKEAKRLKIEEPKAKEKKVEEKAEVPKVESEAASRRTRGGPAAAAPPPAKPLPAGKRSQPKEEAPAPQDKEDDGEDPVVHRRSRRTKG